MRKVNGEFDFYRVFVVEKKSLQTRICRKRPLRIRFKADFWRLLALYNSKEQFCTSKQKMGTSTALHVRVGNNIDSQILTS